MGGPRIMSIKVKLENIDESDRYLYRARNIKIKLGTSKTIETPLRAITNTEMNAKASIPAEIPIFANMGVVEIKLTKEKKRNIISFLKKNSSYNSVRDSAYYNLQRMTYFPLSLVLIQPSSSAIFELHKTNRVDKFLRMTIDLQIRDLGLDIVTIPWLDLHPEEFIKIWNLYRDALPDNIEVIPTLRLLDSDPLEKYLSALDPYLDQIKFVIIPYKKIETNKASYDTLWTYLYDKDIAVILIDVKRDEASTTVPKASSFHYAEFILGDITSLEVPYGGGRSKKEDSKNKKEQPPIEAKLKFFDKEKLTVEPLSELIIENPSWKDLILQTLNREELVQEVLENYHKAQSDPKVLNVMKSISKVHEFIESQHEFKISQKYIKQADSIDYIKEKEALRKIFLGQKTLSDLFSK